MASIAVVLPVMLLVVALAVAVPIIIGTYVYKDAKERQLNAALWTIVAVFAPGFIGLIIYLIVRADKTPLKCPVCQSPVNEGFTVCPHCGSSLKCKCNNCGYPLENGWQNCPNCAAVIPQDTFANAPIQTSKKDKDLRKVLIAVIAIPLVLCIAVAGAFSMFVINKSTGENSSITYSYCDDLKKDEFKEKEIQKWLKDCDKKDKDAYALISVHDDGYNYTNEYLFYLKDKCYVESLSAVSGQNELTVSLFQDDEKQEYTLIFIRVYSERKPLEKVELIKDGDDIDYELTNVKDIGLEELDYYRDDFVLGGDIAETMPVPYDFDNEGSGDVVVYSVTPSKVIPRENIQDKFEVNFDVSKLKNIKSLSCKAYFGGEELRSRTVQHADNTALNDSDIKFDFGDMGSEYDCFTFELTDMDGKKVFQSNKIETKKKAYKFTFGYDKNDSSKIVLL